MDLNTLFHRLLMINWQRKLVALLTAVIVWLLVNHSLTETRTLTNIPVKVIHLPKNKTVLGLLPSGYMKYRVSISVTGTKAIVDDLASEDLEIVISAEGKKQSWIASIDKKNLSNIHEKSSDWKKAIQSVTTGHIYMKVSNLITEEIPLTINPPRGTAPEGYQYLDVWPKYLKQKVTGPEEQVRALKQRGLEVTFNLSRITRGDLEAISSTTYGDEISFFVPTSWKMVAIPFRGNTMEPFNDPRAKLLRIDFLKQELVPLAVEMPLSLFFPIKYSRTLNPNNYSLEKSPLIEDREGLHILTMPLYVRNVSRLFLDTVKDHLLMTITTVPKNISETLHWDIQFIEERRLENAFVEASLREMEEVYKKDNRPFTKYSEQVVRSRFRDYIHAFRLYKEDGSPLKLKAELSENAVLLTSEDSSS